MSDNPELPEIAYSQSVIDRMRKFEDDLQTATQKLIDEFSAEGGGPLPIYLLATRLIVHAGKLTRLVSEVVERDLPLERVRSNWAHFGQWVRPIGMAIIALKEALCPLHEAAHRHGKHVATLIPLYGDQATATEIRDKDGNPICRVLH